MMARVANGWFGWVGFDTVLGLKFLKMTGPIGAFGSNLIGVRIA
jgi:hypothetical protein